MVARRALLQLLVLCVGCANALRLPPSLQRRDALRLASAAALAAPLPALAKTKASSNPNKQCKEIEYAADGSKLEKPVSVCAGANFKDGQTALYKAQKEAMAGDKGSRGTTIAKGYEEKEKQRLALNKDKAAQAKLKGDAASRSKPTIDPSLKAYGG